jgi:hypothetical protein
MSMVRSSPSERVAHEECDRSEMLGAAMTAFRMYPCRTAIGSSSMQCKSPSARSAVRDNSSQWE